MKKLILLFTAVFLVWSVNASAFFIDFEGGADQTPVNDIAGISFLDYNGFDAIYGDSSTNNYNTTSDDLGLSWNSAYYHHNGYNFLFASLNADARGVIVDFTNNDGTWFNTGYSALNTFYLVATMTDGSEVTVSGAGNINGPMGYIGVTATAGLFLDYVTLHDTGNFWLVDDMSGNTTGIPNQVPEPTTFLLLGFGLIGMIGYKKE